MGCIEDLGFRSAHPLGRLLENRCGASPVMIGDGDVAPLIGAASVACVTLL